MGREIKAVDEHLEQKQDASYPPQPTRPSFIKDRICKIFGFIPYPKALPIPILMTARKLEVPKRLLLLAIAISLKTDH